MIQTIKQLMRMSPVLTILFMLSLSGCEFTQDREKEKLGEGLEISQKSLYEDEKGYAHYAFFVKNNNPQTIKSATLRLLILGFKDGMHPNEARLENLAPGDSVQLSVNLFADYDQAQDYHFSSTVAEITF